MRSAELRLLGSGALPPRYVRAFVGACTVITQGERPRELLVYPQLKIFETGVVLVEFRMFSPPRTVGVGEFIRSFLNAPLIELGFVSVPPGVLAWSVDELAPGNEPQWYRRPSVALLRRQHQRGISEYCSSTAEGDFVFQHVPLSLASDLQILSDFILKSNREQEAESRETEQGLGRDSSARASNGTAQPDKKVPPRRTRGKKGRRATKRAKKKNARIKEDGSSLGGSLSGHEVSMGGEKMEHGASVDAVDGDAAEVLRQALRTAERESETFHTLALTLMRATAVVAGTRVDGPRGDLAFALLGSGAANDIGNYWRGRPNVHLMRFSGQAERASENEAQFGGDFGLIVGRFDASTPDLGKRFLPKSSRLFDDYGEYFGDATALWVQSLSSIRQQEQAWKDANHGHLVYENQVKVELLEYGYALHRRIAEQALNASTETSRLLAIQRDLADFEWAVHDTGRFGDARELLARGWEAFGLGRLRARIEDVLRVRHEEATHREGLASRRWTALLAAVAGILAVPPVAEAVLSPLWNWRGWPLPSNGHAAKLVLVGVAVLGVIAVGLSGYWWASRARRSPSGAGTRSE